MNIVYSALVVVHCVGLASLLGGFLVQMSAAQRGINPAMFHGILTQLVTGLALGGMRSAQIGTEEAANPSKLAVKLGIAFGVAVIVVIGRRLDADRQQPYWAAAGGLTLVNVVVAVFWV